MTAAVEAGLDETASADLASASLALARRFSAGATLWCLAPSWEPHAQHVAVEFVHPVVVGTRALPAVALSGPDLVGTARVSVRPGDVLLAVAGAADAQVRAIMQRAPAWGVSTIWVGSGPRPPAGGADHVLWIDDEDPLVPATGRFVLLYHLLWELTHVCFEHPGLLTEQDEDCTDEVCITCSDEGRLAEVVSAEPGSAVVRTAQGTETIATVLVEPVAADELLLVYAGMAIGKVDPL